MKLSDDYVKRVCQPGTEKCCAYLVLGSGGWECAKHSPYIKSFIEKSLKNGEMDATSNNCDGHGNTKKVVN